MSDSHHKPSPRPSEQRRHSIAAKIVFLVFLCTFTTALVVSAIVIRAEHAEVQDGVARGFTATLERSRTALQLWLAEGSTAIQAFALDPDVGQHLVAAATRPTAQRRGRAVPALAGFAEQSIHFDAAALLAPDGAWLVHSEGFAPADGAAPSPLPCPDRPCLRSLPLADGAAIVALTPLDPGNPAAGFVAARFDGAWLAAVLREERHDDRAGLAVTDADGRTLVRLPGSEGALSSTAASVARLVAEPAGSLHEYASPEGLHLLGAQLPLSAPGTEDDWQLLAEVPYTIAFASLTELLTRIFVVDLLLSLTFIAAAYRISTRMLRPIENLAEAARLASAGNLGQAIKDPGTHDEIGRLTRSFNEMMGKLHESQSDLREANRQLLGRNDDLQRANEVLSQLSITDGLTKLHNHRHFQECLSREIKRQSRNQKPLSMLLVDLDDFKALNDRLGHASGDELLVRVASILDATVRESDLLARYGGEEFVVLATDTDLEGAIALAEKVRMAVEQAPHIVNESLRPVRITVSVGVAQYAGNRRQFFEAADRALYRAKDQGKNCVVAAEGNEPLE